MKIIMARHFVILFIFIGVGIFAVMKVSLSVVIVDLVANSTEGLENKYNWTRWEQGLLLSSFYFVGILSPIPAGILTMRYGGQAIVLIGSTTTALAYFASPMALSAGGYWAFMTLRIIQGFFDGFMVPGVGGVLSHWIPQLERASLYTIIISGSFFGPVVGASVSGIISENLDWTAVYYIFSAFGIFWATVWGLFITDKPEESGFTSREEAAYINKSCQVSKFRPLDRHKIPWKSLLCSPPALALFLMGFVDHWAFCMMQTLLPTYLSDVLNVRIQIIGLVSSLPYLLMGIMVIATGFLADFIKSKNIIGTTLLRKVFVTIGYGGQFVFLSLLLIVEDGKTSVVMICLAVFFGAFAVSSYYPNCLEIAPNYTAMINAIFQFSCGVSSILSSVVNSYIVQDGTLTEWHLVFLIMIISFIFSNVVYCVSGSSEVQPWSKKHTEDEVLILDTL